MDLLILIVLILILFINTLSYIESKQYDGYSGMEQSKIYLLKRKVKEKIDGLRGR